MWQGIWRKKKLIIYPNCHHGTAALLLNMASPATRKDIIDSSTSTSASQQIGAEWKNYHTPSPSTFERNKKPTFGTIAKGNSRHILSYRNHRLLLLLFSSSSLFFPFPPSQWHSARTRTTADAVVPCGELKRKKKKRYQQNISMAKDSKQIPASACLYSMDLLLLAPIRPLK